MQWIVSKEAIVGIVRTAMAYIWVWLLTAVPFIDSWLQDTGLVDEVEGFIQVGFIPVVGTLLYSVIRWLAENPKFQWLGYLLVFNSKPEYVDAG